MVLHQGNFQITVGPYTFVFTARDVHEEREHPLIPLPDSDHPLVVVTRYIVAGLTSDFMDRRRITENDIIHEIQHMPVDEIRRLALLSYEAAELINGVEWFADHTPTQFLPDWMQLIRMTEPTLRQFELWMEARRGRG